MARKPQNNSNAAQPGRWIKGQSGNPGGRPKADRELRALAQVRTKEAFAKLVTLMKSADDRVALHACLAILERGHGKPMQAVEHSGEGGGPVIVRFEGHAANL